MKISRILSASVLAGVVLLSTTACFSSDGKKAPTKPAVSSSSSATPTPSGSVSAAPNSSETAAPVTDPSMPAGADTTVPPSELDGEVAPDDPALTDTPEPTSMP